MIATILFSQPFEYDQGAFLFVACGSGLMQNYLLLRMLFNWVIGLPRKLP
jgi:hypothetical protein